MATPLQAAAATGGAGGLAAAGAYGITYAVNSGEEETTEDTELTEEQKNILNEPRDVVTFELKGSETLNTSYNDKILAIVKKTNLAKIVKPLEETKNKVWWDWAFKHKYSQKVTGKVDAVFASVTKGFLATESESTKTSLNQACKAAYSKAKTEYKFEANNYLLENISLFCTTGFKSFDISEPEATVLGNTANGTYNSKIGGVDANKTKLIKETGDNNEYWWKWAFKNRFPSSKAGIATMFQSVTQGYSASEDGSAGARVSLNQACKEAYGKGKTDLTSPNNNILDAVKLFCTLNGNEEIKAPE